MTTGSAAVVAAAAAVATLDHAQASSEPELETEPRDVFDRQADHASLGTAESSNDPAPPWVTLQRQDAAKPRAMPGT